MASSQAVIAPNRTELEAWRAYLRAHSKITRCLEAELLTEKKLSLGAYDVLIQLAEAPERRLRMAELAQAVLLSRSGVTRLVDRLERAGLVHRARVDSDGRGVIAELTQDGLDTLRDAAPTHLSGVFRHFVAKLDEEQLEGMRESCSQLAEF